VSRPQNEAIDILKVVLDNLLSGSVYLKSVLRHCAHVCEILSWSEPQTWFQNELLGYPSGVELPGYRKDIKGRTGWRVTGGYQTIIASVVNDECRTKKTNHIYYYGRMARY